MQLPLVPPFLRGATCVGGFPDLSKVAWARGDLWMSGAVFQSPNPREFGGDEKVAHGVNS
ncbi:hypothetical protein C7B79_31400 [Chroococcidiopsis cubana CCALA 043]|nr:hypothetical protein C7B80_23685 [Cyanosarcina cf. burmensis CCALA 770]PSB57098.1 hypothetical protein C7B79_31400 [Chroococcidiopsis cubana CCALA 043]